MSTYTEKDFRRLFNRREQLDEWLETELLEVRTDGPQPGVWMVDEDDIERVAFELEKEQILSRHPRHDLSAPVLPFPFDMDDFLALAESECFKHSSARWPTDAAVLKAQGINPRTKTLMMALQGHMRPAPRADGAATPSAPPPDPADALPPVAAPAPLTDARATWRDAAWSFVVAKQRAERFGTAKELHRALEAGAGRLESPFVLGTGGHRYCLVLAKTGRPLALKTLQNCWGKIRSAAEAK